jgi:hypothetical protein
VKSTESFNVLIECPLSVMLVFQLYNNYIDANIQILIPLMIQALSLKTPILSAPGQRVCRLLCQHSSLFFCVEVDLYGMCTMNIARIWLR